MHAALADLPTSTAPSSAPPTVLAVVSVANERSDDVLVTLGLEGRPPGSFDPRTILDALPQYCVPAGSVGVVLEGPVLAGADLAYVGVTVYTDRCKWLWDSASFDATGNVGLVVDQSGQVTTEVPGRPPQADWPRLRFMSQCSPQAAVVQ